MRRLKRIFQVLLIGHITACIVLMFLENSLVYPAPRYPASNLGSASELTLWNAKNFGAEEVQFESADGTKLHGWYCSTQTRKDICFTAMAMEIALVTLVTIFPNFPNNIDCRSFPDAE